jgi:hypothetical protein
MKIQTITSQHRRDFQAVYECDHEECGATCKGSGYDDANFHENVIPQMECGTCGKKAKPATPVMSTLYPEGMTV